MDRLFVLAVFLGVAGFTSSADYGNSGTNNQGGSCAARKYRVEGIVQAPYLTAADASGKNSGFIIDVLEAMKKASGSAGWFDYNLTLQPEGSYGDSINGVNTGFIADLVNNKTDIAAAGLTVKKSRQAVIDFLQPFLRSQTRVAVNNANGVVEPNPTYYVANFPSITGFLEATENTTLRNGYTSAKAANRLVSDEAGIAALLASSSPAVYISESLDQFVKQNPGKISLTSDVLTTAFIAFGIQQNQNDSRLCLNGLLLAIQENGQLQALFNKYDLN